MPSISRSAIALGRGSNIFLIWKRGKCWSPSGWTPLVKLELKCLYFQCADLENALAYLNNHLQILEMEGPAQTKKKLNVLAEHLSLTLRQVFAAPRLGPHIQAGPEAG